MRATEKDDAQKALALLGRKYGGAELQSANEAKTRLLVINKILNLLGWDDHDFNPEAKTPAGQFVDYVLHVDGLPRLIVEAKRGGATFHSSKRLQRNDYSLSYAKSAFGKPFSDVVEQASEYAARLRLPYVVLTNGMDWVVANLLPPPGMEADQLKCFYFGNLLESTHNFDALYGLISKEAARNRSLEEEFTLLNPLEADFSTTPRIHLGEPHWNDAKANDVFLSEFYKLFFDEIVDSRRRNMLTHCFVHSSTLDQYEGQLKRALHDQAPAYLGDAKELSPSDQATLLALNTGDSKGRVVLVVGSVGAGKSTFLTKVMIECRQTKQFVFVFTNLINEGSEKNPSISEIWGLVSDQWKKVAPDSMGYAELKQIFHGDLEALRNGAKAKLYDADASLYETDEAHKLEELSGDNERFVEKAFIYYRRKKSVILILDNVDKASEEYQRLVYAFAHKVADRTGATVIVTMRESTFFRAKEGGFLDVRSSDIVFHLQAPDVTRVLSKRIQYIEKYLENDHRAGSWRKTYGWDVFVENATKSATVIKSSLLQGKEGLSTIELLAATAWHNVRKFLELVGRVHRFLGDDHGNWRPDYVLCALMLPGKSDDTRHITSSLYVPTHSRQRAFFLKPRILLALAVGFSEAERKRGVRFSRLVEFCRAYGYREVWSEAALAELVQGRLVECMEVPTEEELTKEYQVNQNHSYRISPLGHMLIDRLAHGEMYLILGSWNLPIYLRAVADEYVSRVKARPVEPARIDPADMDELARAGIGQLMKRYLCDALMIERLIAEQTRSLSEIAIVEEYLERVFGRNKPSESLPRGLPTDHNQMHLWEEPGEPDNKQDEGDVLIPVPNNIASASKHNSTALPRVLWALVYGKANKKGRLCGSDITRIINTHLLDDQHQVEPTNISRALRSPLLKGEKWLSVKKVGRSPMFSLRGDLWKAEWESLFEMEVPNV